MTTALHAGEAVRRSSGCICARDKQLAPAGQKHNARRYSRAARLSAPLLRREHDTDRALSHEPARELLVFILYAHVAAMTATMCARPPCIGASDSGAFTGRSP